MAFLGKNLQMETIPEPPKGPLGRPELLALAVVWISMKLRSSRN